MTLRWLIFFSLGCAALPLAAVTVSGSVRLVDSVDPQVRKRLDYSGVVVWMEPHGAVDALKVAPASLRLARIEQKGKRFLPHVTAIPVGGSIVFPNLDPIFHNAFSNYSGQVFDLGLYPPNTSRTVTFTRPGIVRVFCNIHPTMSAIIAVLRTPWFAVSDAGGRFTISGMPPGDYDLHFFHERATEKTLVALGRTVTVAPGGVALSPVTISETGYVETPHKNKYGHDYPATPDESGVYTGAPK